MKNLNDFIQRSDRLPSNSIPQTEPFTFQSKGMGFKFVLKVEKSKRGEAPLT